MPSELGQDLRRGDVQGLILKHENPGPARKTPGPAASNLPAPAWGIPAPSRPPCPH